jgi:hypothetical protein
MFVNLGKFQDNGGVGYILKPKFLREGTFDPSQKLKVVKHLEVTVCFFFH